MKMSVSCSECEFGSQWLFFTLSQGSSTDIFKNPVTIWIEHTFLHSHKCSYSVLASEWFYHLCAVLEAGSPNKGAGRASLLVCRQPPSPCVFTWERGERDEKKGDIEEGERESLRSPPSALPKGLTPNTTHQELEFQHRNLGWGGQTFSHSRE